MDIPIISGIDVDIKDISIGELRTYQYTPPSVPYAAPVTVNIGSPIVNVPGCVEAHEQNTTKERSGVLSEDDPKGVKVFCDSGMPSFNPIDYNKDELKFEYEAPVPKVASPEKPEAPASSVPPTNTEAVTVKLCPTRDQELKNPVGKILEGNKKITGYERVGKECLMVTENLTIPDQIIGNIPNAGAVTTTASIALVATTSALLAKPLADILLKVVKPTIKKVMKKIAKIRGKQMKIESVGERRAEQRQRNEAIAKIRAVQAKTKK
jgi:hypothetical protein